MRSIVATVDGIIPDHRLYWSLDFRDKPLNIDGGRHHVAATMSYERRTRNFLCPTFEIKEFIEVQRLLHVLGAADIQ